MRLPVHDAGLAVVCLACGTKFMAPSAEIPLAAPAAPSPAQSVTVARQVAVAPPAPPTPDRATGQALRFPVMLGLAFVGLVVLLGVVAYTAYRVASGGPDTSEIEALIEEGRDMASRGNLRDAHAKYREADRLAERLGTEDPKVRALADEARLEQEKVFAVLLTRAPEPAPAPPATQQAPATAPAPPTAVANATAQDSSAKGKPRPDDGTAAAAAPADPAAEPSPADAGATTKTVVAAATTNPSTAPTTSAIVYKRPPLQPVPEPVTGVTDEQIGAAIQRGVDHLIPLIDPRRGVLESGDAGGGRAEAYVSGLNALVVYALLQCGQAIPDERLNVRGPMMKSAIEGMKRLPANEGPATYARGIRATALALYNRKEDRSALRADVQYLLATHNNGAYTYAGTRNGGTVGPPPSTATWDNSNSQYGLLGVWSGAEAGVEVPGSYWADVQKHWNLQQGPDGMWTYRTQGIAGQGTVSMTAAGTASLFVVEDYLYSQRFGARVGREPFSPQLKKALDWWESGEERVITGWWGYTLYGIERVGLASGFKYFGKQDWYRELAGQIVARQRPDGSWGDEVDTSYALLFLARGRHPILMNKLRFDKGGSTGELTGYWGNRPRDAANLARYAGRQLERPLNWQVVTLDREWYDWLDSPILSITSHRPPYFTDEDVEKFRRYVQAGGMLYLQADAEAPEFDEFARQFVTRLFPHHPLTDVPPSHDVYHVLYKVEPQPPLKMVSNGARVLVLYSPNDLSRSWQMRDEKAKQHEFRLGVNLFVSAAGKRELRNRLNSPYVPPLTEPAPQGTTTLARLKYDGGWDPEPGAWSRMSNWFGRTTGTSLTIDTVSLDRLAPESVPVAHLTGTKAYKPTEPELKALRAYVDAGGVVLIDACGGSAAFAESMRNALSQAFPEQRLARLSSRHPLLVPGPPGMEDLRRPRLRRFAVERGATGNPELESFTSGKGAVFLSDLDVTSGLLGTETWGIAGYEPPYAQALVRNLVFWVMDGKAPE